MRIDGGCHCGAIAYEAEIDPDAVVICHCTDCQTLSGSAYRTVVFAPEASFTLLSGAPKTYVKIAESGNERAQTFGPECGSPIYATSVGEGPKTIGIRVGTARQRAALRPSKQYWCRSAQDWVDDLRPMQQIETQSVSG